jgi:ABC-type dipeptide/oligopeptide/nickel transport system ATPase subunit
MASITIKDVVKRYGHGPKANQVIHGVSADVADGEFIVIVGPSGCGKSTLLRMVAGLEEISGGQISIGGRVVNDVEPADRDIAMVFQNYALYPHMSVFDNMAYGLKIAKVPMAEIKTRVDRASFRADSVNVWPWAAPSFGNHRFSCSTNPSATWTPSCVRKRVWRFKSCTANSASPPCSSRTTKSKP